MVLEKMGKGRKRQKEKREKKRRNQNQNIFRWRYCFCQEKNKKEDTKILLEFFHVIWKKILLFKMFQRKNFNQP